MVQMQHYCGSDRHCMKCGELFPCVTVDGLLRELHRHVEPEREPLLADAICLSQDSPGSPQ